MCANILSNFTAVDIKKVKKMIDSSDLYVLTESLSLLEKDIDKEAEAW